MHEQSAIKSDGATFVRATCVEIPGSAPKSVRTEIHS